MIITEEAPALETAVLLSARGFVRSISEELAKDVAAHISGDLVLRIIEDSVDIGFACFQIESDVLYLHGIMIDPDVQAKSIAVRVIEYAQAKTNMSFLGLRTQSPRMWSAGRKVCQQWIPGFENGDERDEELLKAAHRIAKISNSLFPVHVGCYGGPLYGTKPTHSDYIIQQWWDSLCDFERGDAAICVGRLWPIKNT